MSKFSKLSLFCRFLFLLFAAGLSVGFASAASGSAKTTMQLSAEQAVQIARAFCDKIGQPVTAPGTATFTKPNDIHEDHYWQPWWQVTFSGQAEVEVVDATSVIIDYANDAYYVKHQDNAPADETIQQQEAVQRARAAVNAAGQPEPLQFWEADLEQSHPIGPLASTNNWMVRWHRASGGVPYQNQHASVVLDAQTGEIKGMVFMFGSPPLESAAQQVSQDDAASTAAAILIDLGLPEEATYLGAHLEIIRPSRDWDRLQDKPIQSETTRLAWICSFREGEIPHDIFIDAETGEMIGREAYLPLGRVASSTKASPPLAHMLKTAHAVYVREKAADANKALKPFLKFSVKSQPHAVAVLTKTADFRKEAPSETASQEMVLMSKSHTVGVYSYFPATGIIGSGSDWATVPSEFKTWMQKKIASPNASPAQGAVSRKQ